MKLNIVCIPGDGIGPEIVAEAKKVLNKIAEVYGHEITYKDILMGGASIDACGEPLTDEAIADAKAADAVLMGSIGGDTTTSPWYKLPPNLRPEAGLLKLRKSLIPSTLFNKFSNSSGYTFFPLLSTITLFFLPDMQIYPSSSILAKSPVWNHPSFNTSFVASELREIDAIVL